MSTHREYTQGVHTGDTQGVHIEVHTGYTQGYT